MNKEKIIMPIQPIEDGRFVGNSIVMALLRTSTLNLNDISMIRFTDQERMQFAQLIGYSVRGFGELSYVDDETYNAVMIINNNDNATEPEARVIALRKQLDEAKKGIKIAAVALFNVHPDDLK